MPYPQQFRKWRRRKRIASRTTTIDCRRWLSQRSMRTVRSGPPRTERPRYYNRVRCPANEYFVTIICGHNAAKAPGLGAYIRPFEICDQTPSSWSHQFKELLVHSLWLSVEMPFNLSAKAAPSRARSPTAGLDVLVASLRLNHMQRHIRRAINASKEVERRCVEQRRS